MMHCCFSTFFSSVASEVSATPSGYRRQHYKRYGSSVLLSLGFFAVMISRVMFQNMNGLADESLKLKTQMTVIDLNPEILHPYANSDSFNVSNVPTSTAIDLMGIRPRVWEPYPASRQLCFNPVKLRVARNSNNPFPVSSMPFDESFVAKRGILFLKPMKVGGSTASGINLRIAKNMAERLGRDYPLCDNNFDHAMGFMMSGRKRSESFLWTLLRDPTKRAISGFYHFDVSRYGVEPSLENFKAALSDQTDFYLRLHYFGRFPSQGNKKQKVKSANDIMKKYDFMAITERFDESMVILQMLLKAHNVTLGDLLYVKAKSNNGYDDGGHKGKCTFIRQAELTPEMKRFVSTKEWRKQIQWDNAFYAAANRSLDMTIDLLGRETVEKKVELYRWAQSLVKDRCAGEARLPCSNSGVKRQPNETNCLFSDSGCAYECLDAFVADELMQASDSESTTP